MLTRRHHSHRHRFGRLWPVFSLPLLFIALAMGVRWWVFTQAERLVPGTPTLDALREEDIPQLDRREGQPAELVAVIAAQAGRHWGGILDAGFSPDGRWLVTVGDEGAIILWDAATLVPVSVATAPRGARSAPAFSPDSNYLVAGGDTNFVVWGLVSGRLQPIADMGVKGRRIAFAVGRNAKQILAVHSAGVIERFLKNGENHWEALDVDHLNVAEQQIGLLMLSSDEKVLAFHGAEAGELVRLYDLNATDAKLRKSLKNVGIMNNVAFSPNFQTLAGLDENGNVKIHDIPADKPLAKFEEAGPYLAYSTDGKYLAMLSDQGTLRRVVVMGQGALPRDTVTIKHAARIEWASFAADLKTVITASDGSVRVWDLTGSAPRLKGVLQRRQRAAFSLAFGPDGRTLAVGGVFTKGPVEDGKEGGGVQLWDLDSKPPALRTTLEGHKQEVVSLAYSPNGKLLASGSDDAVILWDVTRGQVRKRTTLAASRPLAWAPNSRSVATAAGGTVQLWSLSGEKLLEWSRFVDPKAPPCQITGLSYAPDSSTLATGTRGLTVDLYPLGGSLPSEPLLLEHSHQAGLRVAYSPDGKTLVTLAAEGNLHLWDATTNPPRPRVTVPAPTSTPLFDPPLAISPGGKLAAVAGDDGTVLVLSLTSGKRLREWKMPGEVRGLAFAPDGRHLAIGNANGTVYIIRLENTSPNRAGR